eukprot:g21295.t1
MGQRSLRWPFQLRKKGLEPNDSQRKIWCPSSKEYLEHYAQAGEVESIEDSELEEKAHQLVEACKDIMVSSKGNQKVEDLERVSKSNDADVYALRDTLLQAVKDHKLDPRFIDCLTSISILSAGDASDDLSDLLKKKEQSRLRQVVFNCLKGIWESGIGGEVLKIALDSVKSRIDRFKAKGFLRETEKQLDQQVFRVSARFASCYIAVCECLREKADLERLVLEVAEDASASGALWIEPALSIDLYADQFGGVEATLHLLFQAAEAAEEATQVAMGFIVAAERHLPVARAEALAKKDLIQVIEEKENIGVRQVLGPIEGRRTKLVIGAALESLGGKGTSRQVIEWIEQHPEELEKLREVKLNKHVRDGHRRPVWHSTVTSSMHHFRKVTRPGQPVLYLAENAEMPEALPAIQDAAPKPRASRMGPLTPCFFLLLFLLFLLTILLDPPRAKRPAEKAEKAAPEKRKAKPKRARKAKTVAPAAEPPVEPVEPAAEPPVQPPGPPRAPEASAPSAKRAKKNDDPLSSALDAALAAAMMAAMGKAGRTEGYGNDALQAEVARLQQELLEANRRNSQLLAKVAQLQEEVTVAKMLGMQQAGGCFNGETHLLQAMCTSRSAALMRIVRRKVNILFLGCLLGIATSLHGCSDEATSSASRATRGCRATGAVEAAVEQARDEAMKEGEALKGVQDAVNIISRKRRSLQMREGKQKETRRRLWKMLRRSSKNKRPLNKQRLQWSTGRSPRKAPAF